MQEVLPHARKVARETGIPAHFMIAQAALETGWGKHQIRQADNQPSFNLFGIKAGGSWRGRVVETMTTEYVAGVPQKAREKFRAYNSYEEAFRDYAELLQSNPVMQVCAEKPQRHRFCLGLATGRLCNRPGLCGKTAEDHQQRRVKPVNIR